MNSRTTRRFREAFDNLPSEIQEQARDSYRLFVQNPRHPSLNFKKIAGTGDIYSVRITTDYRALGTLENNTAIWFWIGSHSDYEALINQL